MDETKMFLIDMLYKGYKFKDINKKKFIKKHYPKWKKTHDFIVVSHNAHCNNYKDHEGYMKEIKSKGYFNGFI